MYLLSIAFTLFGVSPAVIRLVSALAGILAILFTFGIGRLLFPHTPWVGLVAAFIEAVLPWDLHFSRYGIRVELLPLLGNAAIFFLIYGWRTSKWRWYALAGAFLGLSLYGYMAARLLPFVFLGWSLWLLIHNGTPAAPHMRGQNESKNPKNLIISLALAALFALLAFAPLGYYFLRHPASFSQRAGQVVLQGGTNKVFQQLASNTWAWLKAIAFSGDTNPRNNLPGAPALTPWLSWAFILGLFLCFRRIKEPAQALLPIWFFIMLLPSVLSEYAPSFQRAIGAVAPLSLITALGICQTSIWINRLMRRNWIGAIISAALLLCQGGQGLYQYFISWGHSNALYYAFGQGIYEIGLHMRERTALGESVYLSPVRQDHATLQFLMRDIDQPQTFDSRKLFILSAQGNIPVEYIVLPGEVTDGIDIVRQWYPNAEQTNMFKDRLGQTYAVVLRSEDSSTTELAPQFLLQGEWEEEIALDGVDLEPEPGSEHGLLVSLYWQALNSISEDYTSFVHFIGPSNPATGTPLWVGADAMPGGGTYNTSTWQTGETIIEQRQLEIPAKLPDGDYYIEVGWYMCWIPASV